MLKMVVNSISPLLLNMVNQTIKTNKFPSSLKISKILPHYKNNTDNTDPTTLRPINIISVLSKIIEKALCIQLTHYLINNNLVSQSLQGGLCGHSSTITVIEIYELLVEALNNDKITALVTLDESLAYEIVDHSILKLKLEHIGVKFKSTKLILQYLTDRQQYTEVNTNKSEITNKSNNGVLQCSTISSLLFLKFTLAICSTTHDKYHSNNISETKCVKSESSSYVDDIYGVIQCKNSNIWT